MDACKLEWDPDFGSVDQLKNVVTNLSTEAFMKLITENLAFNDDNFQTVMVERNGRRFSFVSFRI